MGPTLEKMGSFFPAGMSPTGRGQLRNRGYAVILGRGESILQVFLLRGKNRDRVLNNRWFVSRVFLSSTVRVLKRNVCAIGKFRRAIVCQPRGTAITHFDEDARMRYCIFCIDDLLHIS